jgi:nucleoside phosphorylase
MAGNRAGIDAGSEDILRALLETNAPVSGRRVAEALGISPTTAGKRLQALLDRGFVTRQSAGSAVLWSVNESSTEVRALRLALGSSALANVVQTPAPADTTAWTTASPVGARSRLRVVILTALALEYGAVRSHVLDVAQRKSRSGTRYEVGSLQGEHLDWEVYLAEIDMGNAGSAAEVAGAIEAFSPHLILFVGVAGGLKPSDQRHGDVVVASMVYNVHNAKIVPDAAGGSQVLSRPVGVKAPHRLTQLVRAVSRAAWVDDSPSGSQRGKGVLAPPAVHLRPIVAGEVVLADSESDLRKLIAERFSDAAAIDMESYGVYETAHRYDIPVLAVRGLSDLIGDKNAKSDRELQPLAAANAASFAIAMLKFADEDDFPPGILASDHNYQGTSSRSRGEPRSAEADLAAATNQSLALLTPGIRPWWRRLRIQKGKVADVVIGELSQQSSYPVGWLGRLRHRLPAWLREDDVGDAWAIVAQFAESHDSPHAVWLYDQAARLAEGKGEDAIAGLHHLKAALLIARQSAISESVAGKSGKNNGPGATLGEALDRLSSDSLILFGPVTEVFRSVASSDADGILDGASAAFYALGIQFQQVSGIVPLGDAASSEEALTTAEAVFNELASTNPDVVDQLRSDLLLRVGYALLARAQVDAALTVFNESSKFSPATGAPLIGMALARLQRVDRSGGVADTTLDVSSELAEAGELALLARDRRRAWKVDSGEAVAIAVRARASSDPRGALKLALPVPRGNATDAESKSPQVREAGAIAALCAGEHEVALELAASIPDPVERDLIRAAVLDQMPNMSDEAEQALRGALQEVPKERHDQLFRALTELVRIGAPILPNQPGTVAVELARLREADPQAADIVEALAALRTGQLHQALVITRQYPASISAVEIGAQAAAASGDPGEAFRILERAGRARGDEVLRTQAMFLAADAGLHEEAQRVANQLVLSHDAETRRHALEVQLTIAERAGRWEEVAELGRRLVDDQTLDLTDTRRDQHVVQYRWAVVNAEFNRRRIEHARKALDEPDMLDPRNPSEAMLLLAVLRATGHAMAQTGKSAQAQDLLERALAVASAYPDDEDVMASALAFVSTHPDTDPLPEELLSRARALHQEFFDRFPDNGRFRKIPVGENLSGLAEYLRATFAPRAEQLTDLARQVWLGLCPQSLLAEIAGRSYAEMLIKRVVGCLVASTTDLTLAATERAVAHAAWEAGTVVIDTSALVLLDALGERAQRITAQFSRVLFSAHCRDDVLESRNSLALRSTGTLGWNPKEQRPQLTEFPPEVVDAWAETASRLAQRLGSTDVVPGPKQHWSWDESLLVAKRERVALWADDLPLRHAARSVGVAAFGTLDLITALVESDQLPRTALDEAVEAFRHAYVVDLPLAGQLLSLAAADSWRPDGYAALLVARPRLWSPPSDGFAEFMYLIRALPDVEATPETVTGWAAAAMTGLAWAIPPAARPRALAGIVAWTVLTKGGAALFPKLLEAGENVMAAAAPAGDLLGQTVSLLTETLGNLVPPEQVGMLFTRLLANFDQPRRTQAMQAFLSIPR